MVATLIVAHDAQGRLGIENGFGQDGGQQGTDLTDGQSRCQVLQLDAQADQEMVGQDRKSHMVVPTKPTAQFVVVEADLSFAFLEEDLNRPAQAAKTDQLCNGQVSRAITEAVFDLGEVAEIASDHQPEMVGRQAISSLNDAQAGEVADHRSFAALLDGHAHPGRLGNDKGQRVNPLRRSTAIPNEEFLVT